MVAATGHQIVTVEPGERVYAALDLNELGGFQVCCLYFLPFEAIFWLDGATIKRFIGQAP